LGGFIIFFLLQLCLFREIVRSADIVVAAVGIANYIKGDWIKTGAVVVDCGINQIKDSTKK
jgi:methylenetetrahydrofolate dehydrogenase (NADP+)/methenyltetrahydrofolate cyclohydrolase/formyltetrahydrofolate synthetase